jgi:hypothetical protein
MERGERPVFGSVDLMDANGCGVSSTREIRVGEPYRPISVKLINYAGRAANALGSEPIALDEETLVARAIKKAGSDDFGGDDFREGLRRFLASANTEAKMAEPTMGLDGRP